MIRTLKTYSFFAIILLLQACSGGSGGNSSGDNGISDIKIYNSNSPFAAVLSDCAKADTPSNSCTLETLPLIGQETNTPTIDDIMERVTVSHEWMGLRFEQLLGQLPSEVLPLFKAVTAIVIDADIRPSYYDTIAAAIYLDPSYLWLSVAEKRTINLKEDYRSNFDDPLAFRSFSRYVQNGDYAYDYWSLTDESTRNISDIKLSASRVLLHELAHANDFMPPGSYINLDSNQSVYHAIGAISNDWISSRLYALNPLQSSTMFSLADVMYRGYTPTQADLQISASQVGEAFETDGASDDYGYTTQYEDIAMLFESSMMKYLYDVDHEVGFVTTLPYDGWCYDYQIRWGAIGRIGDLNVKDRAQLISSEISTDMNLSAFFDTLEDVTGTSGNWCTPAQRSSVSALSTKKKHLRREDFHRPYL